MEQKRCDFLGKCGLALLSLSFGLALGCTDKDTVSEGAPDLSGIYHTEKVTQTEMSEQLGSSVESSRVTYSPETLYRLKADGTLIIEYFHDRPSGGEGGLSKERFTGKYKVVGNQLEVSQFIEEKVCFQEDQSFAPREFKVTYKLLPDGIEITDESGESQLLRKMNEDDPRLAQLNLAKFCAPNANSSDRRSSAPPAEATTPSVNTEGNGSAADKSEPVVQGDQVNEGDAKEKDPSDGGAGAGFGNSSSTSGGGLPPEIGPAKSAEIFPSVGQAAGVSSRDQTPSIPRVPQIEFTNRDYVARVLENASITCDQAQDCPESVGLLIGKVEQAGQIKMFQCSTTYLGRGYFSTNSHCYPHLRSLLPGSAERQYQANCKDSLWVKLPKSGEREEEMLDCERIVYLSDIYDLSSPEASIDVIESLRGLELFDLMIFRVQQKTERSPQLLDVSYEGQIDEEVFSYVVNPDSARSGLHGQIEKKTCKISDPRQVQRWFEQEPRLLGKTYSNIHLSSCTKPLVQGNSGSTILNKEGKGIAILSHGLSDRAQAKEFQHGYGSRYFCVAGGEQEEWFSLLGNSSKQACQAFSDRDLKNFEQNELIQEHNQLVALINATHEKLGELRRSEAAIRVTDSVSGSREAFWRTLEVDGPISFRNWDWKVHETTQDRETTELSLIPPKRFIPDSLKDQGLYIEGRGVILNQHPSNRDVPLEVSWASNRTVKSYGLPSCYRLDREKLERTRTDFLLNPFTDRSYQYPNKKAQFEVSGARAKKLVLEPWVLVSLEDVNRLRFAEKGQDMLSSGLTVDLEISIDDFSSRILGVSVEGYASEEIKEQIQAAVSTLRECRN